VGTWAGVIVESRGSTDLWNIAQRHGVRRRGFAPGAHVLIDCDIAVGFDAPQSLAQSLSRDLLADTISFVAQTAADVYDLQAFVRGEQVRHLSYSRDDGGWVIVEGEPQSWEAACFFGDGSGDVLDDDISPEDLARYQAATRSGDVAAVLDLLRPSSTSHLNRLCLSFGIAADQPAGALLRRSLWSRLWGRP